MQLFTLNIVKCEVTLSVWEIISSKQIKKEDEDIEMSLPLFFLFHELKKFALKVAVQHDSIYIALLKRQNYSERQ